MNDPNDLNDPIDPNDPIDQIYLNDLTEWMTGSFADN